MTTPNWSYTPQAAQRLQVERGDQHIAEEHLADAIELLLLTRDRLQHSPQDVT
jgi:hypothetical protein